jgi:hypothetical protein
MLEYLFVISLADTFQARAPELTPFQPRAANSLLLNRPFASAKHVNTPSSSDFIFIQEIIFHVFFLIKWVSRAINLRVLKDFSGFK